MTSDILCFNTNQKFPQLKVSFKTYEIFREKDKHKLKMVEKIPYQDMEKILKHH